MGVRGSGQVSWGTFRAPGFSGLLCGQSSPSKLVSGSEMSRDRSKGFGVLRSAVNQSRQLLFVPSLHPHLSGESTEVQTSRHLCLVPPGEQAAELRLASWVCSGQASAFSAQEAASLDWVW